MTASHTWGPGQGDQLALEGFFTAGDVLTVDVVRLEQGWRIERLSNQVVWRPGSGWG